jgi:hypothetical protein
MTPLWLVVTLVTLIGELLLVLGLSGIVVRQARRAGWLGLAGFVLMFIGEFLFTSYDVTSLLVSPWLAQDAPQLLARNGPPSLFVFFLLAGILFSLGGYSPRHWNHACQGAATLGWPASDHRCTSQCGGCPPEWNPW